MNSNYLERLQAIVATGKSKQFTKMLNKQPRLKGAYSKRTEGNLDLLEWVKLQTAAYNPVNLNHAIHIIIHGEPPKCPNGYYRKFNTYEKGYYTGCVEETCNCDRQSQAEKLKSYHENLSAEQKAANLAAARKTSVANWGVSNPMQSPEQLEKLRQRNLEKTGYEWHTQVPDTRAKMKQTWLERYGTESPLAAPEIQAKTQATTIERYGKLMTHARAAMESMYNGLNPFQVDEVKQKSKQSMLEKYGTEYALQNPDILTSMMSKNQEKYGVKNVAQIGIPPESIELLNNLEKFAEFANGKTVYEIAQEIGYSTTRLYKFVVKNNIQGIVHPRSLMEYDLCQWLDENNIKYKRNDKIIIKPYEIDILLLDFNVGIELHGLFHHSIIGGGKPKDYHRMKFIRCKEKNIQLLQFWQDEYWQKKNIIKSKILYLCKLQKNRINARSCNVATPTTNQERNFYNVNHIQGFPDYRQKSIAAYHNNKIVACMSWAKNKGDWELVRYATDINYIIPGMFSKLLKASINEFNFNGMTLYSYSDNRISDGNVYSKSGWAMHKEYLEDYCYTKNYCTRENKSHYMKSKICKKYGFEYTKENTEWYMMQQLDFDRLYDAGKIKWKYFA